MATVERPAGPPEGLRPDDVAVLLAAATSAPSVHNSQPWRFAVAGAEVRLHLDRSRTLPVADPTGREAVISCGAALEGLVLAMGHLGHAAEVTLQPDPDDHPDHLATVRRGPAQEPDRQAESWYAAVRSRRMHRQPFGSQPVAGSVVAELKLAARHGPVWCREVTGPEQRWLLGEVAAQAAGELLGDPAYRAELAGWTRRDRRRRDGIPLAALGEVPYPESGLPWGLYNEPSVDDEAFQHDVFLVIGTGRDGVPEWLEAGRALLRVLLHATCRGLGSSLLTQALELPSAREILVEGLALPGQPQVLLRVGHPTARPTRAPRRPIGEVLET